MSDGDSCPHGRWSHDCVACEAQDNAERVPSLEGRIITLEQRVKKLEDFINNMVEYQEEKSM